MKVFEGKVARLLLIFILLIIMGSIEGDATTSTSRRVTFPLSREIWNKQSKPKKQKRSVQLETYRVKVGIGTPPQYFKLLLDTGSSDLWVYSKSCWNISTTMDSNLTALTRSCRKHHQFSSVLSSTYTRNGSTFFASYNGDDVAGFLSEDAITFYPYNIVVENQYFEEITLSSKSFSKTGFEGYLGLSPPTQYPLSNSPVFSFLSLIDESMTFSLWLPYPKNSLIVHDKNNGLLNEEDGFLIFGAPDPSRYIGPITYIPLWSYMEWEFMFEDILTGGRSSGVCGQIQECVGSIQSSYPYYAGPEHLIEKIVTSIGAMTRKTRPLPFFRNCKRLHKRPVVSFTIGGRVFDIRPEEYTLKSKDRVCYVMFSSLPMGESFVFGSPFLSKYYSVYHQLNRTIGFALAAH